MNGSRDPGQSLFERLRAGSKRVEIDGQTYWRVEGDVLLDEDQLLLYAQQREAVQEAQAAAADAGLPLVAMADPASGRIVRWAPGVVLTYTVLRKTFVAGGDAGYELAVASMRKAAGDWEKTCGISFFHQSELDGSDDLRPPGVLFVIREHNAGGSFIAAAFFPTDPVSRRRLLIDPSFYSPALIFDRTGVLRHELGHVLGFRHEHIRSGKPPGCPDEDTYGTIDLSDYDPRSVMHYFCGGLGSAALAITETDKISAQHVYGLPLASFAFAT
jgi:hypothetical protein